VIAYADDFVVTAASKELLEGKVIPIKEKEALFKECSRYSHPKTQENFGRCESF
jgi:hypothetical protein